MTQTNGTGNGTTVIGGRPMALIRYRSDAAGQAARFVHLVPLPSGGQGAALGALCGALLHQEKIEIVALGQGVPCTPCLLRHASADPGPPTDTGPPSEATSLDGGIPSVGMTYRGWGWPVAQGGDQIRLHLERDAVALIIPISLAAGVREILIARRSLPAVVIHPYAPDHRILLAGERYAMALPWPPGVHRLTGTLLLPPTVTPRGPLVWAHPPQENSLRLCREIDIFGALRLALMDSPPAAT